MKTSTHPWQPKAGVIPLTVRCPQCDALAINNVACHETGCQLSRYPWKREGNTLVPDTDAGIHERSCCDDIE